MYTSLMAQASKSFSFLPILYGEKRKGELMRAYKERVGSINWIVLTATPGNLAQDLSNSLGKNPQEVLVDFSHVTSISSADGVALCRHLWSAHRRGSTVVLGAIKKRGVRRFIDNAGFSDYFPCEERLPEAIAHFRNANRNFLGEMLVRSGQIDDDQLEHALQIQEKEEKPRRLGNILTDCGYINQGNLLRVLFRQKIDKLAA